ncbi:putative phosphoinositide phosphatase [Phaeomoniella chlamydospora]|uniref:Putative phosphoinositide phosphatase n=1 Tax=Phaeomoniella chlamydospora TaxID=158046 RepID=A0A0G2EAG1_PHACM|nr:putative phosphoinositide phosphatase [Phaeomoniella chlamydospora]
MAGLLPFRDINVHASNSHYAFTSPSTPSAPTLVIERPSGNIRLNDGSLLGAKRVSSIAGILGIIKLKLDKYVIVITKAQPMGRIRGHMAYKILATEFLPLRERPVHDPDEDTFLALLKILLKTAPMYFSYSFDLTNSFQRQSESDLSQPLWKRADDRFLWNRFAQSDLIDFRNGGRIGPQTGADAYILPVISGVLRIVPTSIKANPFTFVLITRKSRHRTGTRYFSRGIDEQGHVSNYNETEQIVLLNDDGGQPAGFAGGNAFQNGPSGGSSKDLQILSFVQTRGSVPVYWAEINNLRYTPKLQIRGVDTAIDAAKRHFNEQIRIYGENYLVNLVNKKGREEKVKRAYEDMVRALISSTKEVTTADQITSEKTHVIQPEERDQKLDRLHYIYFDFHSETKGLRWYRTTLLLDQLTEGLEKGAYFRGVEMPGDPSGAIEARMKQTSVVRTNCMDCLDRTNVVQSMLGRWALTRQLQDVGILPPGQAANDDPSFEFLYRNIWADNADVVSKAYSGTGALKTDFTRTGNRTRRGALQDLSNSITRYILNNFMDGGRQDAYDIFLGAYLPSTSGVGSSLIFADRRPLLVQSVPYVLAASVFLIFVSLFTRSVPGSSTWAMKFFLLVWFAIGCWAISFIYRYGPLYVNWPKLNPSPACQEACQDSLSRAFKDKIAGQVLAHASHGRRNLSGNMLRMGNMEEGKKRTE